MINSHGALELVQAEKAEETKVIRVPESKVLDIKAYLKSLKKKMKSVIFASLILLPKWKFL